MTYTEIARRSKLSVSCVSRLLGGHRQSARIESVVKIAKVMGMRPGRLLERINTAASMRKGGNSGKTKARATA